VDQVTSAALDALLRAARSDAATRRHPGHEVSLLQSVVDAAVILFEAQAASIALFERRPDRLEFRVAAGPQGAGVVGLSVPPTRGIAGYVFSTGQPIALSDVSTDPRFDRATAERTGYVPRSIAAVPLSAGGDSLGVLQVLDRTGSGTFSLSDMSLMGVFADQAAVAIRVSRVTGGSARLLGDALRSIAEGPMTISDLESVVSAAAVELDSDDGPPFWQLVDGLSRLGSLSDHDAQLIAAVLEVVARHRPRTAGSARRAR
jgi:signal transduction protein with GAF and PtsI domain